MTINRQVRGIVWLLLANSALFLGTCSAPPHAQEPTSVELGSSPDTTFDPDAGSEYGVDGSLSDEQFAILTNLAWPQVYPDMIGTFGYPLHRTETADYYASDSNPQVWIVIFYSGTSATQYELQSR